MGDGVQVMRTSETGCYFCGILDAFHKGPDLYAPKMNRFHVNLTKMNGKWYLSINGLSYPVKYCPSCGRKLDENTKYEVTDWL